MRAAANEMEETTLLAVKFPQPVAEALMSRLMPHFKPEKWGECLRLAQSGQTEQAAVFFRQLFPSMEPEQAKEAVESLRQAGPK